MKPTRFYVASVLAFVVLVGISVWIHSSMWNECRETNSFMYCYFMVFGK